MSRKIDTEQFVEWCQRQSEMSRSSTARYIVEYEGQHRCRIREEETPEDVVLVKGKNADTVRFEKEDKIRQFRAHRRDFEFHNKTLIVRDKKTEKRITSAGTGTRRRRGPFPV